MNFVGSIRSSINSATPSPCKVHSGYSLDLDVTPPTIFFRIFGFAGVALEKMGGKGRVWCVDGCIVRVWNG